MPTSSFRLLISVILCLTATGISAQQADFSKAVVISWNKKNPALQKAVQVFREEIKKHSVIDMPFSGKLLPATQQIIIGIESQVEQLPAQYREALTGLPATGQDGFRIKMLDDQKTLLVIGHEERGALYGAGYLLRKMELRAGQALIDGNMHISSTPAYPIRGHQLGYRPKTNAYDAWTVNQFDSYIRDLSLFGVNSIEILPPNTDDDFSNGLMKLPAIKMIAEQSRICKEYGLDVWMWYPNMGSNYTSEDSMAVQLAECERVFKILPKLDALFVPGGDPGDLEPSILFKWLERVAVPLKKYHPRAKIWVSPQVFRPTTKWFDAFYREVNNEYPWFGGVVYGPWTKQPIQQVRQQMKKNIPIRQYPDITHSLSCQYPVPEWDLAYAITLGRECYNPRPEDEKHIHNLFAGYAQGSISYSEGINDDVNKFVWSGQDWDPNSPVIETLRDYARLFIGPDYAESLAQSILALEKNLKGPLAVNSGVARTLQQWQDMERKAPTQVSSNFRFRMGLIRACYDAYIQRRLLYETELEQAARDVLTYSRKTGAAEAISDAKKILLKAVANPVQQDLRQHCMDLADSLFMSIGSQLTVKKHGATAGRGNFIDNIDLPLNNSLWLLSQFAHIEKLPDERSKWLAIDTLLNRTNPGPGGFYDDLGSPESRSRIARQKTWEEDPGGLESPLTDFGVFLKGDEWVDVLPVGFEGKPVPLAWMNQVTTLYNTPLIVKYDHLDQKSSYTIRVAYTGRFPSGIKLVADEKYMIHDFILTGKQPIYEFPVPMEAIADGSVQFTFSCREDDRGTQVAEIWLIKIK
ncbi:MAG: alpha-glucuronidase family glycosyl hydrolase [Flavitalea sp.]